MYESDEEITTPVSPSPAVPGKSKVTLVSLIANAVFVVGIVIVVLLYRNKLEKVEIKADNAVINARAELNHMYKVAALHNKLKDTAKLSDIDAKSYPLGYCKENFTKGTSKRVDIDKVLLNRTGPVPEVTEDGKKVKYAFSYPGHISTIIMIYDNNGVLDDEIEGEVKDK